MSNLELLLARGSEALAQRRYADAVEVLQEVLRLEPSHTDALFQLASAWQQLGQVDRTIEVMRRAERLQPNRVAVLFNLGVLLAYYGDHDEAIGYLRRALDRVQEDGDPQLLQDQRSDIQSRCRAELDRLSSLRAERSSQA